MRIRSRRAGFFFPCSSFFLLFSLSFSLSFSPHGGDTTVPSALHLFNKDLLCSKTLIQNTHAHTHTITNTHTHTRRSRLLLVTGREEKKKKVRDVGLETLGALFVNSHSDERRESRLAHRGRNANYGLLCLHVAHAHTPTRWFGATIINLSYMCLWWGGCIQVCDFEQQQRAKKIINVHTKEEIKAGRNCSHVAPQWQDSLVNVAQEVLHTSPSNAFSVGKDYLLFIKAKQVKVALGNSSYHVSLGSGAM